MTHNIRKYIIEDEIYDYINKFSGLKTFSEETIKN